MRKLYTICFLASGAILASSAAQAHVDVGLAIGVPWPTVVVSPPPAYYEPPPVVYYEPVPVYVEPRPVVVAPGYYGGWQQQQWGERRWREHQWRTHYREWRR